MCAHYSGENFVVHSSRGTTDSGYVVCRKVDSPGERPFEVPRWRLRKRPHFDFLQKIFSRQTNDRRHDESGAVDTDRPPIKGWLFLDKRAELTTAIGQSTTDTVPKQLIVTLSLNLKPHIDALSDARY